MSLILRPREDWTPPVQLASQDPKARLNFIDYQCLPYTDIDPTIDTLDIVPFISPSGEIIICSQDKSAFSVILNTSTALLSYPVRPTLRPEYVHVFNSCF